MASTISVSTTPSDAIALGGASKVSIQELGGNAETIIVEGSNDNILFTKIAKKELGPLQLDVIYSDGCAFMRFSVESGTASIAVNPFDRAASSEAVQEVALNATPPVIDSASGGVIVVTGATAGTTIKAPEFPYVGERLTIINKAEAAWTFSGNGNNVDGVASINFPARLAPRGLIFDGDQWNTYDGVMPTQGTFIPALATASGNLVPTYTIQNGYFNVIGNMAFISGQISYSAKSGGTAGDNLRLSGIPAWLAPAAGQRVTGYCSDANDMFFQHALLDYGSVSAATWTFTKGITPGIGASPVKVSDLAGGCGDGVTFFAIYRIA